MKKYSAKKLIQWQRLSQYVAILFGALIFPGAVFSQPPPPTGSGGSGTLPDSPLGVPFDSNMSLLLVLAGVVFAVVILKKVQKNRALKGGLA